MSVIIRVGVIFGVVALVGCTEKHSDPGKSMNHETGKERSLGFKDFVKNPDLFEQHAKRNDSFATPKNFEDDEISKLVEALISEDSDAESEMLEQLGEVAVPHLVTALGDKRFHDIQKSNRGMLPGHFIERSPIERVLDLLFEHRPASAVKHLSPLVRHEQSLIRYQAANALGNIGTDDCVKPLRYVLAGDDENTCWGALNGIKHCLDYDKGSDKFRGEMFSAVESVLRNEKRWSLHVIDDVPNILMQIARDSATEILLSDEILNRDYHGLNDVLEALNEHQVLIPTDAIFQLVTDLHDVAKQRPYSLSYGKALIALARTKHPQSATLSREAIEWNHKHFGDEAASAICLLHEVDDPAKFVLEKLEGIEFKELSLPQQHFIAVSWLQWDVNNGGFTQYFFNSSGDFSREALVGLKAINANKTAVILQKAMSTFGTNGPAKDRDERQSQLANLFDEQDSKLDSLNDEFYEDKDVLDVKLLLFVAENSEQFRTKK